MFSMILRFFFFAFLIYLVYKLIVDFAIPLYKTTRRVKQSFRDMQQKMQEEQNGFSDAYHPTQKGKVVNDKEPLGDYIDFEEVKE